MKSSNLLSLLKQHQAADAVEAQHQQQTIAFVTANPTQCCSRHFTSGHITTSAWIVDPQRHYALLTHHRKLNRWLQLGGHMEGETDVLHAALREAREESGLDQITPVSTDVFDIDVHPIPARGEEPEHLHYDVRFLFEADHHGQLIISAESHDLRWFDVAALKQLNEGPSIDRMVHKMLSQGST